jgi:hypothetical protein
MNESCSGPKGHNTAKEESYFLLKLFKGDHYIAMFHLPRFVRTQHNECLQDAQPHACHAVSNETQKNQMGTSCRPCHFCFVRMWDGR